jgi:hypothetical protein
MKGGVGGGNYPGATATHEQLPPDEQTCYLGRPAITRLSSQDQELGKATQEYHYNGFLLALGDHWA